MVSAACAFLLAVGGYFASGVLTPPAHGELLATGQCLAGDVIKDDTGSQSVTLTASEGQVISEVSIKAGTQCFTTTVNGTISNCYTVSGIGTGEVTVERIGSGPDCKEISHVEALVGSSSTTGTTATTGTTETVNQPTTVTVVVPGETPAQNTVTQVVTMTVTTPGQTVTTPGQTVTLPGQTVTQTQTIQGTPQTVTVAGPTKTVTVTKTKTKTVFKAAAHKAKRKRAKPHFTG